MLMQVIKSLRWSISLGVKFIRVVPFHTSAIVTVTLVSQLSSLLASFLPLKVVILLGSDGVPHYFPASFAEMDRDILIAGLSAATLGFFLVHVLAERLIDWITGLGTSRLLKNSHKMVLFENQDQVAAGGYQRYSRALASGVFIVFSLCGLGWFYPEVSLMMVGYAVFTFLVLWLLHRHSSTMHERLDTQLREVLNVVAGVGFFVTFGYLVSDFILWRPPGVIVAIVTLILSRQIMTRSTGLVADLAALHQQGVKLDALFFHGKVLLSHTVQPERSMWPLLQPLARQHWIRAVMEELVGKIEGNVICKWHQTGQTNVAALKVETGTRCYLVKLFEKNRSSLALHEATLMGESIPGLPAPCFVGATQVQKFHCLLYEVPKMRPLELPEVKPYAKSLLHHLLTVEPPPQLCHRYQRSRPMLWQRFNIELLERLRIAANTDEEQASLVFLLDNLARMNAILKGLPMVIYQPDLSQDAIRVVDEITPLSLNWGRWSLEPLGAGWPVVEASLSQLETAIVKASESRPALHRVATKHAELSALAFALVRECNSQRYVQALEILPALMDRLTESRTYFMREKQ